MSGLRIDHVSKSFGRFLALDDIDLDVADGRFICLLGPSGCGKTTLLRVIAGLEEPSLGRVLLDGADITTVPAHKRGLGMVFQSLALFPHLSVGENVAYGLRVQGVDRSVRQKKAAELLELVRLPGAADRQVAQLSGGQRQRVAIARALALDPKLFLLDEPVVGLGRQAARGDAGRTQAPAAALGHLDDRGHPRSAGSHDHGRHRGGDGPCQGAAGRLTARHLPQPGQRVCRRLHRVEQFAPRTGRRARRGADRRYRGGERPPERACRGW